MNPLVSVILPTYNRADFLGRSIGSVLGQTFSDFELIVVDDASTDHSREVIDAIDDQRLIYLKHERNRGGSAARNTGIKAARGKFIAFQDSDDEWLPEKLEKQITILTDTPYHVGVAYTGFWRFHEKDREYIPGPFHQVKEGQIHRELLKASFITTQAAVVKKECFQKAGMFDETLPRLQDWELFLRISKYYEFRYIPEPLVHSFFTEGCISSKPKALVEAIEIILKKHLEDYKTHPEAYANQLISLSAPYESEYDLKKSREYLLKAFKISHRPGLLVAFMASFWGRRFFNFYWKSINEILGAGKKT
jgi:glycosyltransferase involved in cell wall biosynthesis